jgi:hypothetical protein
LIFAVAGTLLQAGLWIISIPAMTSLANVIFAIALRYAFSAAEYVMHPPPSPIFGSGLWGVISYFVLLTALVGIAGYQLTRIILKRAG